MDEAIELPRVSVGRWKGEPPYPGGGPVMWQCNRCGHHGEGCNNENTAYKEAAEHECPVPPPGIAEGATQAT